MCIKKIHLYQAHLLWISHNHLMHLCIKFWYRHRPRCEEILAQIRKTIIHRWIKLISKKPYSGILPYLTNQEKLGFYGFYSCLKMPPEIMVHLICHIQPPSINICFSDPVCSYIYQIFLKLWIGSVELRHLFYIGKSRIIRRFLVTYRLRHIIEPVIIPWLAAIC